ncbi:MAG: ComF family protein [Burkholderiales bacterium]
MFTALIARTRQASAATRALAAPSTCAICRAWPSRVICSACIARFAPAEARCRRCAIALVGATATECGRCVTAPPPLDRCIAAVGWRWPWSELIASYKFGREPGWASALAALLLATDAVPALIAEADLLLPVPLAPERLRERGFNQALQVARRLAPTKFDPLLLQRIRLAPPQASLARSARLTNVRGAFALDAARCDAVRGRSVLLVDDVMTTGSTLFEAARVLREAGAARVTALVLARADDPRSA